jgi:hypothetical protein
LTLAGTLALLRGGDVREAEGGKGIRISDPDRSNRGDREMVSDKWQKREKGQTGFTV